MEEGTFVTGFPMENTISYPVSNFSVRVVKERIVVLVVDGVVVFLRTKIFL